VAEGENPYTKVVSPEQIAEARQGRWSLYLSDCKPVPVDWFTGGSRASSASLRGASWSSSGMTTSAITTCTAIIASTYPAHGRVRLIFTISGSVGQEHVGPRG
jgi:hypothetical protein